MTAGHLSQIGRFFAAQLAENSIPSDFAIMVN